METPGLYYSPCVECGRMTNEEFLFYLPSNGDRGMCLPCGSVGKKKAEWLARSGEIYWTPEPVAVAVGN